ncbi:hypothetical protein [Gemmata sp. SH-PL17]|uniref:VMAP-C domain-containing protein n=1 Tax=Gemmata sp. SH-PL17 TaxID=1630693 RepID=UPI0012F784AC|nr:hypothetical protein [Gemmata sp. SH-PL17]
MVARLHRSCLPHRAVTRLLPGDKPPHECAAELLYFPIDSQTRYTPVLAFVRELRDVYPTRAPYLNDWLRDAREWIAADAGLETSELSDLSPDVITGAAGTLVCVISPDDSRGERWGLRSWLYGPPTGPEQHHTIRSLGEGGVLGTSGAFMRDLSDLMRATLDEVAEHTAAAVSIDFFVPRGLRHIAIDQCLIPAPMTGQTRLLGVEYPVVLRCVDRATAAGANRARAAQIRRTVHLLSGVVHEFTTARHTEDPSRVLAAGHDIAAVLVGEPVPADTGTEAPEFFTRVIEDGVPIILWSRSGPEPAAVLRDLVAGGLGGLPRRIWDYRRGHPGASSDARLREHLSLVYDPADEVSSALRPRRATGPAGRSVQP